MKEGLPVTAQRPRDQSPNALHLPLLQPGLNLWTCFINMSTANMQAILDRIASFYPTAVPVISRLLKGDLSWDDFVNRLPFNPVSQVRLTHISEFADTIIRILCRFRK